MTGVTPLARQGGEVRKPRLSRPRRGGAGAARPLAVARAGERIEGRARGTDEQVLAALGRGEIPVELSLDLHRLTAEEARCEVRRALARSLEGGLRCVLLIHGRGTHSAGGPTLKRALPGWLAEAPHGRRVRAFVTAPPALGGSGATLVLLQRKRGS